MSELSEAARNISRMRQSYRRSGCIRIKKMAGIKVGKLRITAEKHKLSGHLDQDDWGVILPPEDDRRIIKRVGSSKNEITDVVFKNYDIIPNHENGGFYGYESVGKNFRDF